jgi:hypothetical protein
MPTTSVSKNGLKYFWYWKPEERFPPPPVVRPEGSDGTDRLNVACTQTGLAAREERAIVSAWCEALPKLTGVRFLWFSSRVPQRLFESACQIADLEGLYIKWSGIDDLSSIQRLQSLQYLHLGPSARVASIDALEHSRQLRWLGLELLSRITDLEPVGRLVNLEGLSLEGSMGTTWRVETLAPVGRLTNLRYLSIANIRSTDGSLDGLRSLHRLATFRHATWWDASELAEIRRRNPDLAPSA